MTEPASRTDPASGRDPARRPSLAVILAAAGILGQIGYPLASPGVRTALTVATVVAFAAACACSALTTGGPRALAWLIVAGAGIGMVAEVVGVATGVPFGRYAYTDALGPRLLGVPLLVPFAWLSLAWPCLVAGRRVAAAARWRPWTAVPLSAVTLAAWDLSLDPQMVAAGAWRWAHPAPSLPGIPGIPVTNVLGWLLVAGLLTGALHAAVPPLPAPGRADVVPALVLAWTWLGSTLGSAVFFGRPGAGAWVFGGMGAVTGPYLALLRAARRRGAPPAVEAPRAASTSRG